MREIKFRAYKKSEKKILPSNSLKSICINSERLTEEEWNDLIIMQYTGFKDKNGKEIYEGDILLNAYKKIILGKTGIYKVEFSELFGTFEMFGEFPPDTDVVSEMTSGGFEIIGNIYENPEFLNN